MNVELRNKVLLSVMRALWGEVFSTLRAVVCFLSSESLTVVFYVDGAIHESDLESIESAVTEVISDFPAEMEISHDVRRIDYPWPLDLAGGLLVYLRKERSDLQSTP